MVFMIRKDYDGWNFWIWEKGKEGKRVDFIGEDEEGKFAVIKTSSVAEELGFILRKSIPGNDWASNYLGSDKFISLNDGDKEIVISNGTYEVKDLNRNFDKVTLNLHYYRFNGDYTEWDV